MRDPYYGLPSVGDIHTIRSDPQTLEDYGEPLVGLHITMFNGRRRWRELWYLPLSQVEQCSESADAGTPTDSERKELLKSW
jgi:hypothetical protein